MIYEIILFFNRHPILVLIWFFLLISLVFVLLKESFSKIQIIANTQAIQLINKKNGVVIDLRLFKNFQKKHIINSINITQYQIQNEHLSSIKKYKRNPIILVSENGIEALNFAKSFVKFGFKYIFVLKDGIQGWSSDNLPLILDKN